MAAQDDSPRQSAGWVVAAIVAVVAVCAVSFMITQRPQQAMAVAEGDPLTGETPRSSQAASTPTAAPPSLHRPATPKDGSAAMPTRALDANAAAVNASSVETDR